MKHLVYILASLSGLSLLALAFLNSVSLTLSVHMVRNGTTYEGWSHQVTGAILAVIGATALIFCLIAATWQLFKAKPRLVAVASGLTFFHMMAMFGSMFASLIYARIIGDLDSEFVGGIQMEVVKTALKTFLIIGVLLILPIIRNFVMPRARATA